MQRSNRNWFDTPAFLRKPTLGRLGSGMKLAGRFDSCPPQKLCKAAVPMTPAEGSPLRSDEAPSPFSSDVEPLNPSWEG